MHMGPATSPSTGVSCGVSEQREWLPGLIPWSALLLGSTPLLAGSCHRRVHSAVPVAIARSYDTTM